MECKRNFKVRFMNKHKPHLFYYFSIFSISFAALFTTTITSATPTTSPADIKCQSSVKADLSFHEIENKRDDKEVAMTWARRFLTGPGSSPPRCISKCGKCTPCKPVHVPVPPGTPVTAEYYPEAWRCKCGNKLYMP
ncbi:EPIDERMAL PATTERNING FACTOR-like protein 6 [Mangifera indica]|uniref:EPIDERMAL PATTERNING FACTOR-like protein 6 n=1 Tax=Mangifera indica TaxID=29780 RepID=UPI001CFC0C17|nr:EPIDERMAL PATTERNING FACTOR-like protein 6 [Mangifera indica]